MAWKPAFQVFAIGILSVLAAGQDTYSISGSVVNSVTGEPVKNALVSAQRVPSMDQLRGGDLQMGAPAKTTFSGSAGEFEFTGLSEASYQVSAQKPGFNAPFADAATRPPRIEKLTASVSGVQIKLAPFGSIEGKITDQYGDPVPRANVAVISVSVLDGYRTTMMNRTVTTDDRGVFRMWNLAPGKYYVKATGKSGGTYMYVGESSTRTDNWESFAPAYFGGGSDLKSATPIVIGAGTAARADMNLMLAPSFKIRGTIGNFTPHESVTFSLLQGDEEVSASRSTLNGTTGKFEIEDVVPGSYVLRAQQGTKTRGEVPVTVGGADVNDVAVTLWPAVTLKGTVKIIGSASDDLPPDGEDHGANCMVDLEGRAAPWEAGTGRFWGSAEFSVPDVFPGVYGIRFSCDGGYLFSVHFGDVDLLENSKITIQNGTDPQPIEITLKRPGGTLKGEFRIDPLPRNIGALMVPTFPSSTGPIQLLVPSGKSFNYSEFAPGEYLIYAISNLEQLEFRDPAFLQSLTGGVSVKIEDGKTSEVTLTSLAK